MLLRNSGRLSLLTLAFVLVLIAPVQGQATSDPKNGDSADVYPGDPIEVRAGTQRAAVERGAEEGEGSDGCRWSIYVSDDLVQPIFENGVDLVDDSSPIHHPDGSPYEFTERLFSETGRWFQAVGCDDLDRTGIYAEGDAISLGELADEAYALLDPPQPAGFGTSPPDDKADRFPVVKIPTWFWVEEPLRSTTYSARASYPPTGPVRVWAEAFALADRSEWSPGDGSGWFDCVDLGLVYRSGMSGDDSDCAHTYLRSSVHAPDDVYRSQGRVWFEVWWESSLGAPNGGPLPPLERESAPVELRVGEIQAIGG